MDVTETRLPLIPIGPLLTSLPGEGAFIETSKSLLSAAKTWGFLYIREHGIPEDLYESLHAQSKKFFDLPLPVKNEIKVDFGEQGIIGYFAPRRELTNGHEDSREGIYFGTELEEGDDAGRTDEIPFYGPNLWPAQLPTLRHVVEAWMKELERVGHALMRGLAVGLDLEANYFMDRFGQRPTMSFGMFQYPPVSEETKDLEWGVGEHTDYGFLTILKTDEHPGLEVQSPISKLWVEVSPIPGTFVVNFGDMLQEMTGGYLRSTPHRVRIQRNEPRLSFPYFFDPDWSADLSRLAEVAKESSVIQTWADAGNSKPTNRNSLTNQFSTYGEYMAARLAKCAPVD